MQRIRTQRLLQRQESLSDLWTMMICFLRMHSLRLRSVWKRIRPLMFFIPMRTRYGLIFPNISSRISNRISIWICSARSTISATYLWQKESWWKRSVCSAVNLTVPRTTILSSGVPKKRRRSVIFQRFYITGDATRIPLQKIRRASSMHLKPEEERLKRIIREKASMQR